DDSRPADLGPARRRGDRRERVQPARHGPPRLPGAGAARPDRHQERGAVLRHHRHRRQSDRRCPVPRARPAAASERMTQTAAPATAAPTTKLAGHLRLLTGAAITGLFVAVALLALVWTPDNPTRLRILQKLQAPLVSGLLGTDHLGRDVLSMLMAGAVNS